LKAATSATATELLRRLLDRISKDFDVALLY
jgi:hypothetical protein